MDPGLIDFLMGIGFGFIDEEMVTCPNCGAEFLPEEIVIEDMGYACPACQEILEEHG
jgi:hypothetical protein